MGKDEIIPLIYSLTCKFDFKKLFHIVILNLPVFQTLY